MAGSQVFLGYNQLYNFNKGIEVAHTVGAGEEFTLKELIPTTLRYPGKWVWDKDNETYWYINQEKTFTGLYDATLIRDSLQLLEDGEMLDSNYVLFEGTQSVHDKILSIESGSLLKLPRVQLSLGTETFTYTINGQELEIHSLYINRLPYFGVKGAGNIGLMDFYYEHMSGNTVITLAPALNLAFSHQDLLDIFYTT